MSVYDALGIRRADRPVQAPATTDGWRSLAAERLARGDAHAGLVLTSHRRLPRSDPRTLGRLVNALDALLSSRADAVDLEYWLG